MDDNRDSDRVGGLPHPRDTALLVGHAGAEAALLEAYRSKRLPHAWLIGGPSGIGKATLAWRFARFVLAHPDPDGRAVQEAVDLSVPLGHPVWGRLRGGASGDVAVLRREWNDKTKKLFSDIRVDDVRDALQLFQRSASSGGYRICLLDSAEDLNTNSANALLKVVEEPPRHSLFLIVAHRPMQVLPTILSRCRKLILGGLQPADVVAAVRGTGVVDPGVPDAEIAAVAARSGGSVGRTLRLLDETRLSLDRDLRAEMARLPIVDARALHRIADRLGSQEGDAPGRLLLDTVLDWLDAQVHAAPPGSDPRRLAPFAEVWEKITASARDAEALNLDQRPLLLSIFADLAQATRLTGRI